MKSKIGEWSIDLLRWVTHQRQRGCSIFAINEQNHICEELDLPFLGYLDRQAATASQAEYPRILADEIKNLIEEGRVEEAEEAIQVMKILGKASTQPLFGQPTKTPSISSSMKLVAAKILAEEGDPKSAVTLVEKTRRKEP